MRPEDEGAVLLGVLLLECSVAFIALGANIQRLALSRIPHTLRRCGNTVPLQTCVWLSGLTVYFSANVIYTIALVFAPASLCATLMATIIIANAAISRILLGEELHLVDWQGGGTIFFGIMLAASAAPYDNRSLDASELYDLLSAPASLISLGGTHAT